MDNTTRGKGWANDLAKTRLWIKEGAKARANFRPNIKQTRGFPRARENFRSKKGFCQC